MSKQILYNAMDNYYKARAGSASDALFKSVGTIAGLATVYFNEQRKKAQKKFEQFDVSEIPTATALWNAPSQKLWVNELTSMNNEMNRLMKRPNKNAAEIMQVWKKYENLKGYINKMPGFVTEAKANMGEGEGGSNYSMASNDNYINQIINEDYQIYKYAVGEYMIRLLTDTPDDQLTEYEGTLDDFQDMIFLERKDIGDNVVSIIDKIVKNDRSYEDGELQQTLSDITADKKTLSSAFWDDIFQLTSGPFDSTTLAGQFAFESGHDAAKMEEYRVSSSVFRNLDPEEQKQRLDEMSMYVRGKLSLLSTSRWQNNQKKKKGGSGSTTGDATKTLYFDGRPMETFKEKYKSVTVNRVDYSPRVINNLLEKIESKYREPGSEISFKWGNDYYIHDGQNWISSGRLNKKRKRWDVVGTDTQLLDSLGFGDYLGMASGGGSTGGGGEFDNMGFGE